MGTRHRVSLLFAFILIVIALTGSSYAIPAFSRQYGTSCSTCHVNFPKLNDFGKAFKDAGFKFPKDDETFMKDAGARRGCPNQHAHGVQADNLSGQPQFHLLWLEALGRIFAEKRSDEFVDQPRLITGSHDHRCVEPQ
jgi:hypothetical protein